MKLEGSYKIAAPRAKVWMALLDPKVLARAIPGCEKLEPAGEHRYQAVLKAGVGAIKGTFTSEITLTDLDPQKSYTLTSRAKAPVGFVEGKGRVRLEETGGETTVKFSGEAKVGGMLASIAGRLVEAAAQKNIHDLFTNLAREIERG